jgi:hypothetical protein
MVRTRKKSKTFHKLKVLNLRYYKSLKIPYWLKCEFGGILCEYNLLQSMKISAVSGHCQDYSTMFLSHVCVCYSGVRLQTLIFCDLIRGVIHSLSIRPEENTNGAVSIISCSFLLKLESIKPNI